MQEPIPKPDELLALHDVTEEMFGTLRRWFDVPTHATLDLTTIDSAVVELSDPVLIAAMAMRKLQALHLLSTPGVRTTTDVVLTIVQDLQRALLHAPSLRLTRAADTTDWDAALARLDAGDVLEEAVSDHSDAEGADPEVDRFRELHARLVIACEAVLQASGGEIRVLV